MEYGSVCCLIDWYRIRRSNHTNLNNPNLFFIFFYQLKQKTLKTEAVNNTILLKMPKIDSKN